MKAEHHLPAAGQTWDLHFGALGMRNGKACAEPEPFGSGHRSIVILRLGPKWIHAVNPDTLDVGQISLTDWPGHHPRLVADKPRRAVRLLRERVRSFKHLAYPKKTLREALRALDRGLANAAEFTDLLARADLRQVDVGRLVTELSGMPGPDAVTVNRYCAGRRPVNAGLAALVELYSRQPKAVREALLPGRTG